MNIFVHGDTPPTSFNVTATVTDKYMAGFYLNNQLFEAKILIARVLEMETVEYLPLC